MWIFRVSRHESLMLYKASTVGGLSREICKSSWVAAQGMIMEVVNQSPNVSSMNVVVSLFVFLTISLQESRDKFCHNVLKD